jgi:hypothetical protein
MEGWKRTSDRHLTLPARDPLFWKSKNTRKGETIMTTKKLGMAAVSVLAFVVATYVVRVNAAPPEDAEPRSKPQEVTLTGRVVDLHCFMTGQYPTEDKAKCTADALKQGAPAGLATKDGIIILGQGTKGPARTLVPLAFQEAEVSGNLYTNGELKYLDIASAKPTEAKDKDQRSESRGGW